MPADRQPASMGRRSSDSEDDSRSRRKKKQRRRSSSSSSSSSSSNSKVVSSRSRKSTRLNRSRSRDKDKDRRHTPSPLGQSRVEHGSSSHSDLMCTQAHKDNVASHHCGITGTSLGKPPPPSPLTLAKPSSLHPTPLHPSILQAHNTLVHSLGSNLAVESALSHSRQRRSRSKSGSRSRRVTQSRKRSSSRTRRKSRSHSRERDRSRRKGREREREKEKERERDRDRGRDREDKNKDKSKDKAVKKGCHLAEDFTIMCIDVNKDNLLDLLSVLVEFWCQQHFKLNQTLVEKGLKDLAEHFAVISQDVSPVVLAELVVRITSTRLKLTAYSGVFAAEMDSVGDEPIYFKKMVLSYLPALGNLAQCPSGARLRTGPTPHSGASQGAGCSADCSPVIETSLEKENVPKGLNRRATMAALRVWRFCYNTALHQYLITRCESVLCMTPC
ncbi:hypothetical protein F7725_020752 [Dissostichus mawsoni]|uniref:Uncharacterized protein n=1 Tax=Dissostichus mawsoni TaxID=36200 RepID=A0A7J5YE36_DISMA|nr:hypothetical protein F7725_020752 [Dissostichus mawsoni]